MHTPRALLLVALMLLSMGCPPAHPPATTAAPQAPPYENFAIDFKEERPAITSPLIVGLARPSDNPAAPDRERAALAGLPIKPGPLLVTLGEVAKYDGAFPGDHDNWKKWDKEVEAAFRKYSGRPGKVEWEIWNEPDRNGSFKGNREDFFAVWIHTWRLLKRLDAKAVTVGPSTSNNGWVQEFLKVAKEYEAPPAIVCWHEDANRADVAGHINGAEESFWQDGTDRDHVRVMQTAASSGRDAPGDAVVLIAGIRDARRQVAWRGLTEELAIKSHHLTDDAGRPKPIRTAIEVVTALPGAPVKVDRSDTVGAVATRGPDGESLLAVVGRAAKPGEPTTRPVRLTVRNAPWREQSDVAAWFVRPGTNGAVEDARLVTARVAGGEVKLDAPFFARGQIYRVRVLGIVDPSRFPPATQPAIATAR